MTDQEHNSSSRGSPVPGVELDWHAICYLLGELPAGDEVEFEQRLAEDQAAREALAAAVEIVAGLDAVQRKLVALKRSPAPALHPGKHRSAGPPLPGRQSAAWKTTAGRLAIALAASALLALTWSFRLGSPEPAPVPRAESEQLADAWLQTRTQLGPAEATEVSSESLEADIPLWDDPAAAPRWMLLAIGDLAAATDQNGEPTNPVRPQ